MNIKFRSSSILFLLILLIYTPFVINAGFGPGDDWVHVQANYKHNSFFELLKFNLDWSESRPVAGFILAFTHYLFGNEIFFYNIFSVSMWVSTSFILSKVVEKLFDKQTAKLFFLIIIFPYLCAPMFIGNHLWAAYIGFVFFWSLALYYQVKFSIKLKYKFFILFNLFFLLSILTLELILPLIMVNFLISFFFNQKKLQKKLITFSILSISISFLIFKMYILPEVFNVSIYGMGSFSSLKNLLQGIFFYYVLIFENLILLLKSIKYINIKTAFIFLILLYFVLTAKKEISSSRNSKFLIPFIISLLIMPIIFIISGYPATSFGTNSRMLIPSFVCFSIIVAFCLASSRINKYIVVIIIFLFINTFVIQIDNQIDASKQRERIHKNLLKKVVNSEIKTDDQLVVYVPIFLNNNFNNEEVFYTRWNFEGRLTQYAKKKIKVTMLSDRMILDKTYYPNHNFYQLKSYENNKQFFYNYKTDELTLLSRLELDKIILDIENNINIKAIKNNIILNEKIRLFLKNHLN